MRAIGAVLGLDVPIHDRDPVAPPARDGLAAADGAGGVAGDGLEGVGAGVDQISVTPRPSAAPQGAAAIADAAIADQVDGSRGALDEAVDHLDVGIGAHRDGDAPSDDVAVDDPDVAVAVDLDAVAARVDKAVRQTLFRETAAGIKDRNADADPEVIEAAIDEAINSVRETGT